MARVFKCPICSQSIDVAYLIEPRAEDPTCPRCKQQIRTYLDSSIYGLVSLVFQVVTFLALLTFIEYTWITSHANTFVKFIYCILEVTFWFLIVFALRCYIFDQFGVIEKASKENNAGGHSI